MRIRDGFYFGVGLAAAYVVSQFVLGILWVLLMWFSGQVVTFF